MKRAYTLIEVLVVLAIIAALAVLLFPALSSARKKSGDAVCVSNLSQIGKAIALYSTDYDGFIPRAPSPDSVKEAKEGIGNGSVNFNKWAVSEPDIRAALKPYGVTLPLWRCPLDVISPNLVMEGGHASTFFQDDGSSYHYDDLRAYHSQSLASYPAPADQALVTGMAPFHGGGKLWCVLFADLHVKNQTTDQYIKDKGE